jgi:predicted nuclease with RNAse H fold
VSDLGGDVTTAGVDFASQSSNTAACIITWRDARAEITEISSSCDDTYVLNLVARVAKLGIDVPLGWPSEFVKALNMHAQDGSWPEHYEHLTNSRDYRMRRTDTWVHDGLGLPLPLSVATDRIAIPAMRAAALFVKITPRIALDGSGVVTEVYPAAALARWGFTSKSYKGAANVKVRTELVDEFCQRTSEWLDFKSDQRALCIANDNVFDALVAALVGRAALVGLIEPIPLGLRDAATREGWIAIPREGSFAQLALAPPTTS